MGLDTGHLIYAAGGPCPEPYEALGTGVRLVVHALDVAQPLSDVEQQVGELNQLICGRDRAGATAR